MVGDRLWWLVEGRNLSHEIVHRRAYPLHYYSEQQMSALLQALTAKSALSYDEIAGALCRKNKRTSLLEVHNLAGQHFTLACGPLLEWTARVLPQGDVRLSASDNDPGAQKQGN